MKLRNIVIVGAVLSIAAGFILGKTLLADAPAPGSNADPVVSKSYVDNAVQQRLAELEKAVAELSVQSQALQNTINELQAKVNKTTTPAKTTTPSTTTPTTPANPSTGANTPGTTPSTGTTTPGGSTSLTGKTAYIKSTNNYVNLRKGPSTNDEIVQKVNKGEPMLIIQAKDDWFQVHLSNGVEGWVASWVVDVK